MTGRSKAGCRFFQRLTHRFGADRVDEAKDQHLVSQQFQRPMALATGQVRAGQLDQFLLDVPSDLDLVRATGRYTALWVSDEILGKEIS